MTPLLITAGVVLAVLLLAAAWWRWRQRARPAGPPIARDEPSGPATLAGGLAVTRRTLGSRLGSLLSRGPEATDWEALEEALLEADVGVAATAAISDRLRRDPPEDPGGLQAALRADLLRMLERPDRSLHLGGTPAVVVVVGVNGSGKTTTIAKLGGFLQRGGSSVLLGAADTFRAAAAEQLGEWAGRLGLEIVAGQPGADPASVAFDALAAARARGKDVVVVDTAGRLHSKRNLMEELGKVVRVLEREAGAVDEVLLVLDGTSGQNALAQARVFTEVVGVTGAVITKLDGTARGGFAVAVEHDLGVPVKFLGVGEAADDLLPFDADEFVDALLGGGDDV